MQLRPSFLQGFLIALGGIVFAFFGCLGAISSGGFAESASTSPLFVLGGLAFVAGLIAFVVGGVLFIIAMFKAVFGQGDASSS